MSRPPEPSASSVSTDVEGNGKVMPLRKPVKCPNCKTMSSRNTYPFCSKRCADVDLGRWFNGSYAIDSQQD